MFLLIFYLMFFFIIFSFIIFTLNKINNLKKMINKSISIECGFNSLNNNHIPMINNFFIIMMIFMIFDLEFFLLIPLINLMKTFNWIKLMTMIFLTMLFMYYSMMYEIKFNSIKWIK